MDPEEKLEDDLRKTKPKKTSPIGMSFWLILLGLVVLSVTGMFIAKG